MHLSSRAAVLLLVTASLLPAGLGVADHMVRASVDEERQTRLPADMRFRFPRDPVPDPVGAMPAPPSARR